VEAAPSDDLDPAMEAAHLLTVHWRRPFPAIVAPRGTSALKPLANAVARGGSV
jgi:hypothetical protein